MDELLAEFDKLLANHKTTKRKTKITTGKEPADDPLLTQASETVKAVKKQKKAEKGYQSGNGYDYVKVWNEDGTAFIYKTKARDFYEKYHGVKLEEHHRIFFADRTLKGDAKYAKENLLLGFKAGVSLDMLTCSNCGCRGNWTVNPPSNGNQGSAE